MDFLDPKSTFGRVCLGNDILYLASNANSILSFSSFVSHHIYQSCGLSENVFLLAIYPRC